MPGSKQAMYMEIIMAITIFFLPALFPNFFIFFSVFTGLATSESPSVCISSVIPFSSVSCSLLYVTFSRDFLLNWWIILLRFLIFVTVVSMLFDTVAKSEFAITQLLSSQLLLCIPSFHTTATQQLTVIQKGRRMEVLLKTNTIICSAWEVNRSVVTYDPRTSK